MKAKALEETPSKTPGRMDSGVVVVVILRGAGGAGVSMGRSMAERKMEELHAAIGSVYRSYGWMRV